MPKVKLDIGATVDFLSKDELADELQKYSAHADAREYERLLGVKYMRMPRLYASPSNGTVRLGEPLAGQAYTGPTAGPNEGYAWSIQLLAAAGLGTSGPDLLNIYRSGYGGGIQPVWQLNGNNFAYTFGGGKLILLGGEQLIAQSVGSMTSTSQISLYGDVVEVPREMLGKLVL